MEVAAVKDDCEITVLSPADTNMEVAAVNNDCEITVLSPADTEMREITSTENCQPSVPMADDNEIENIELVTVREHPFGNKINRDIFIQKVLSIFLLQTIAVGGLTTLVHLSGFQFAKNDSYYEQRNAKYAIYTMLIFFYILLPCLTVFNNCCDQIRKKSPYNYIILICQPIVATAIILLLENLCRTYSWGFYSWKTQSVEETFHQTWKDFMFVQLVIVVYSAVTLGCQHAFNMRGSMFLAAGVFIITYLRTLILLQSWNGNTSILKEPFSDQYITLFLYLCYLYVLYDIYWMTGRDYHQAINPDEYVNGAVNLQIDYIIIILNLIKIVFKSRVATHLMNAVRNKLTCCGDGTI